MLKKQRNPLSKLAVCARGFGHCYRYANLATHHVLGALLKLLVAGYFLFALLFLFLRYAILPNIDFYKKDIEHIASRALGNEVSIARIYASWQGLRPYLFLGDVVVRGKDGHASLSLPSVSATLSWWSVAAFDVRFERLEIGRPELEITRDRSGKISVAGIVLDNKQGGDKGKGLDWLLEQREIVIRGGALHWTDAQRGAARLSLTDVNLLIRNQWRQHQMALQATPPAAFGSPLDVRADFTHPPFTRSISDATQWKGELYTDVQDTDLAAWLPYVDYPVAVQQGHGSVRAWLALDHAKLDNFTADLTLSNAVARLGEKLEPVMLKRVNGRISARETFEAGALGGRPAFGALGHSIELTNFSLETSDGLTLPPTSIVETYTPARKGEPEKTTIAAKVLDMRTLFELGERLPLAQSTRQLFDDFAPRGQVSNLSAQWQGAYPAISAYKVSGDFKDLALRPQKARPARVKTATQPAQAAVPAIPGFANLTGSIDANEKGGKIKLASDGLNLQLPDYFAVPVMTFKRLAMQARWTLQPNDQLLLDIDNMDFVQDGLAGSLSGKHLMPMDPKAGQSLGHIDVAGHIDSFDVATIKRYLPLQTPPALSHWLSGGLESGYARDVTLKLRGDLADFPFAGNGKKKGDGEFRVAGKLDGVTLNYTPGEFAKDGKSPFWPQAQTIRGNFVFDRTRMEINGDTATTGGVALTNVQAVIADLASKDMLLEITGSANGALAEFVRYVNVSPVADWIANFTEQTRAVGQAKLGLKLQLPLEHIHDAKVQGTLQFLNNDIVLQTDIPPLLGANGKLTFNEHGFDLPGVNASLLGGPVFVNGGTQKDGSTAIRANGAITTDGLRKNYAGAATARLIDQISGGARYQLAINIKNHQSELLLESTLAGLGSKFPEPLRKAAGDALPFKLAIVGVASDNANVMRDEIRASLGSTIAIRYARQKTMEKDAPWRVIRGGIGVNEPAPEPDSGMLANVTLKSLNLDAWRATVETIVGTVDAAAAKPVKAADPKNADSADALTQYVDLDVLAAKTQEMTVMGKKLDNVVVGASHQKDTWQANIDSAQIAGYVTWKESSSNQNLGKATARLTSLVVSPAAATDVTDLLEDKATATRIPALDIVADNFELFGKKFGRLELVANNTQTGGVREWRINKLSLVNPDAQLTANGKWGGSTSADSSTSLHYTLQLTDAGKLLERFGFANVLRAGSGKMDGDVSWKGVPFSLDIPSLSGKINLDLGAGQFLKVEPGAAKLLGVLSLQALPHLLKLDFRDVFSEGLAFDGISASATIAQGVAKTDNLKMRSVSATVLMDGSADIAKESQNLRVVVIPEFNLGTGSLVYMLAVNPVIGLGTFLAQLFLREPVMKALTFQYQITGPWKDPVVTKIGTEFAAVPKGDIPAPKTPAAKPEAARSAAK